MKKIFNYRRLQNSRVLIYILHYFPDDYVLPNLATFVKTGNLTLIQYYYVICRLYSDFIGFFMMSFLCYKYEIQDITFYLVVMSVTLSVTIF